jgi:hypothetical protein
MYTLPGRIFGFLLGFSLASAYASYHLLEEYQAASAQLQASVEELQASTRKVRHIKSILATQHLMHHPNHRFLPTSDGSKR